MHNMAQKPVQTLNYLGMMRLLWINKVIEEMYAFLGIMIAMDIIKLLEIRDYWSRSTILNIPWFHSICGTSMRLHLECLKGKE